MSTNQSKNLILLYLRESWLLMACAIIYLEGWLPNPSCGLPGIQTKRAASSFLLGLAPGRGCLAANIAICAGSLLHCLFTIAGES